MFLLNEGESLDADGRMNSITGRVLAIPAASVTNSGASSSRALHVELTSQQRRLRHLRSIAARNIVNKNGSPLLDTYFTLHLCIGDRISRDFYKSEVIRDSLNPTWRSLDLECCQTSWTPQCLASW